MIKVKLINELPPNAPFGSRPETHFIKLPNNVLHVARQLMNERAIKTVEQALLVLLKDGMEIMRRQHEANEEQKQSGSSGDS